METTTQPVTTFLVRENYGPKPNDEHLKLNGTLIDMGDGSFRRVAGVQDKHVHTVGRQMLILVPYEPPVAVAKVAEEGEPVADAEPFPIGAKYADLLADRWLPTNEEGARAFISHLV